MAKKAKQSPSAKKRSGVQATNPNSGSGPGNVPPHKHGNTGAPHEGGDHQVQGASHQGSSLGKRNSG